MTLINHPTGGFLSGDSSFIPSLLFIVPIAKGGFVAGGPPWPHSCRTQTSPRWRAFHFRQGVGVVRSAGWTGLMGPTLGRGKPVFVLVTPFPTLMEADRIWTTAFLSGEASCPLP